MLHPARDSSLAPLGFACACLGDSTSRTSRATRSAPFKRYETNNVFVRDGGDSTYVAYGLTGLPETFFLDRRGRVISDWVGEISEEELEAGIDEAIAGEAR